MPRHHRLRISVILVLRLRLKAKFVALAAVTGMACGFEFYEFFGNSLTFTIFFHSERQVTKVLQRRL